MKFRGEPESVTVYTQKGILAIFDTADARV